MKYIEFGSFIKYFYIENGHLYHKHFHYGMMDKNLFEFLWKYNDEINIFKFYPLANFNFICGDKRMLVGTSLEKDIITLSDDVQEFDYCKYVLTKVSDCDYDFSNLSKRKFNSKAQYDGNGWNINSPSSRDSLVLEIDDCNLIAKLQLISKNGLRYLKTS